MKIASFGRTVFVALLMAAILLCGSGDSWAQLEGGPIADMLGPAPGEQFTSLSSGIFTYSKTDMSLPGPMPINVTRVYRSQDRTASNPSGSTWNARDFGLGTRLSYDIFLHSYSEAAAEAAGTTVTYTDAEVIMPDGGRINCENRNTNTGDYTQATFVCDQQPTGVWFNSTITWNATSGGWDLTRTDGTVYHFGADAPLESITDRYGNSILITWGGDEDHRCQGDTQSGHPIAASSVNFIYSSNGRSVYFCYDDTDDPTGISKAVDSVGYHEVDYSYGTNEQLQHVRQISYDPNGNADVQYQYAQMQLDGFTPGLGDITTITSNVDCTTTDPPCNAEQFVANITYTPKPIGTLVHSVSSQLPGNGYQYSYTFDSTNTYIEIVNMTLPDGATRHFKFDAAGYLLSSIRNLSQQSVSYETTVFVRPVGLLIGDSHEFVTIVEEKDSSGNLLRKTTYSYDKTTGDVLSVKLSPAPGDSQPCCSSSATWNYTYEPPPPSGQPPGPGHYNRILSASEPLSYAPATYSYADSGSAPTMTVTDPLGNALTTTYNAQGQPTSIPNALGYFTTVQYNSYGDIQWIKDPTGAKTSFTTDSDGRVTAVTSPLNETTTYAYSALDEVTDIYVDPSGLNLHTNYTYDLLGELKSSTTPNGNTTKISRSGTLGSVTVTDPLGFQAVTNLDGLGRKTDYTDKRGVQTTYKYDLYGRVTKVVFNANGKTCCATDTLTLSNYDALDRLGTIADSATGGSLTFAYDSLNNFLSEANSLTNESATYGYDSNGRRISMQSSIAGIAQPTVNYRYDCDDELIGMSNDGSALPSCGPGIDVDNNSDVNGTEEQSQFSFLYDPVGVLFATIAQGVLTWNDAMDNNGRVTDRSFFAYPGYPGLNYGDLSYSYDADGRLVDKAKTLAAVNLPPIDRATYTVTDQLATFNGASTSPDKASNITTDPVTGDTYLWDGRNQLHYFETAAGATLGSEGFDAMSRRETSYGAAGDNLWFLHDGSSVLGWWNYLTADTYDFLEAPGGGTVAGTFTPGSGGTPTTLVPLTDLDGSTIALVNAATPDSGPVTSFVYDPSGGTTASGAATTAEQDWPFRYEGMEHEITDPAQVYYSGGGQFYEPAIQRGLSETGATGISGAPTGPGPSAAGGSLGGGGGLGSLSIPPSPQEFGEAVGVGAGAADVAANEIYTAELLADPGDSTITFASVVTANAADLSIIGAIAAALFEIFYDIFGGGPSAPPPPRQLNHGRNQLYAAVTAINPDLTPSEQSPAPASKCSDAASCTNPDPPAAEGAAQ
jgi:YD repeat-containing protein